MSILKSETKVVIMGLLNERADHQKERLYTALYAGLDGAKEAKALGEVLRSKEDFDDFVAADVEVVK